MALTVSRVDVWAASLKDRPGALAEKLAPLSDAGANFAFVIARRTETKPGTGVVFVTPLAGREQLAAAKKAKFKKTKSLHSVKVESPDKPGLTTKIAATVAEAGINVRGVSAAAIGKKCILYVAFDKADDATKAARLLRKL
jgi:hypothetical protein